MIILKHLFSKYSSKNPQDTILIKKLRYLAEIKPLNWILKITSNLGKSFWNTIQIIHQDMEPQGNFSSR